MAPKEKLGPVTEIVEEDDEYHWRHKVGRALEKVGKWLQGTYTAESDDERQELELYVEAMAEAAEQVAAVQDDEDKAPESDVSAYGLGKKWRKWKKQLAKVATGVVKAVVINKVAGAVASATGR